MCMDRGEDGQTRMDWTEEISYPSKVVLTEKGWSRDDFKSGFTKYD